MSSRGRGRHPSPLRSVPALLAIELRGVVEGVVTLRVLPAPIHGGEVHANTLGPTSRRTRRSSPWRRSWQGWVPPRPTRSPLRRTDRSPGRLYRRHRPGRASVCRRGRRVPRGWHSRTSPRRTADWQAVVTRLSSVGPPFAYVGARWAPSSGWRRSPPWRASRQPCSSSVGFPAGTGPTIQGWLRSS